MPHWTSLPAVRPGRLAMAHNSTRLRKGLPHRTLERIDRIVDGLDRGLGIDAAVKQDNDAARGLAHPNIVDVAQAPLRRSRCGERSLDATDEMGLGQLTLGFRLGRFDVGLHFDALADFPGARV